MIYTVLSVVFLSAVLSLVMIFLLGYILQALPIGWPFCVACVTWYRG